MTSLPSQSLPILTPTDASGLSLGASPLPVDTIVASAEVPAVALEPLSSKLSKAIESTEQQLLDAGVEFDRVSRAEQSSGLGRLLSRIAS